MKNNQVILFSLLFWCCWGFAVNCMWRHCVATFATPLPPKALLWHFPLQSLNLDTTLRLPFSNIHITPYIHTGAASKQRLALGFGGQVTPSCFHNVARDDHCDESEKIPRKYCLTTFRYGKLLLLFYGAIFFFILNVGVASFPTWWFRVGWSYERWLRHVCGSWLDH